jgi:Na+-driven multidrug efflux pump
LVHVLAHTGYPIPLAIAAAFTTLSAPLYAQPDARHHIGHWLQRAVLLSLLLSLPVMLFWWFISPLLLALKQPPELVAGMKW